jgi:hypothetical protein
MKAKSTDSIKLLRLIVKLLLLAAGLGIVFAVFVTPGLPLYLSFLGGMLIGIAGTLILSTKRDRGGRGSLT